MNISEALRAAANRLAETSDTARLDAELLMAHALGVPRSRMLLDRLRDAAPASFGGLIERRAAHEPIAYITGEQEFYGRPFRVSPAVLIPRGDSETAVTAALEAMPAARRILDLGTGSGALLITLLAELPAARGVGIDRAADALEIARANAEAAGVADRADMRLADWTLARWAQPLGRFDLVIANPPYVEDTATLSPSVREHEPHEALFAGAEGLDDYRVLLPQLASLLDRGGVAVLEIGYQQAETVTALAADAGLSATLRRDLGGRPRALILRQT